MLIISWNIHKINHLAQAALHQADSLGAEVVFLQEITPTRSGDAPGPASGKYYKLWAGEGRLAGYVAKSLPLSSWQYTANKDLIHITIHTKGPRPLHIFGVYSEPFTPGPRPWDSPLPRLAAQPRPAPGADVIIIGDINLHHPSWDAAGRTSTHANTLLNLTNDWDLSLLTPAGLPTWRPQGHRAHHRPSTIDHTWASAELRATHSELDWPGSDHTPQACTVPTTTPSTPADGFCWARLDNDRAASIGRALLLPTPPAPRTTTELEHQTNDLIGRLTGIMHACVPAKSPPRGRRSPGWDAATATATTDLRVAERRVRAGDRSQAAYDAVREARNIQRRALRRAGTRHWRAILHEASAKDADLWRLEKWARARSHAPSVPPLLPPLRRPDGTYTTLTAEKAQILCDRFFPTPEATPPPPPEDGRGRIFISQQVSLNEVSAAVYRTSPRKAPGPDQITNALLRACGDSLFPWLRNIAAASLRLGHWPAHFKASRTIIIPKPGKTAQEKQDAKGWRPIALLSTVGKVIEAIVARRLTEVAENNHLLPEGQMGNRRYRSTELAARLLTDAVRHAWDGRRTASLLQLDIQGAFDNVHHGWLIYTLHALGLPAWLVNWVANYLSNRTTTLTFDGVTCPARPVTAGVPQGSPLSPILFILFTTPLYHTLLNHQDIIAIGFADDTNLLATGRTTEACCYFLRDAWATVTAWARPRGVVFEPAKSELLHFSRAHKAPATTLALNRTTVLQPRQMARFLGIWLDRKLLFSEHLRRVKHRLTTQAYALTKLAGKTWGCTLPRARTIYTAVLRSTAAYGAAVFLPNGSNRRPTVSLDSVFHGYLRTVLGAYRSTPTHLLHTEAGIPPLDLYLQYRRATFLSRPDYQAKARAVRRAAFPWSPYNNQLPPASLAPPLLDEADWASVTDRWKARWQRDADKSHSRTPATQTPCWTAQAVRRRHLHLTKAESSLLTQIRTGHIGLRAYLFRRQAVDSPTCQCGAGDETAAHVILSCAEAPPRPAVWPRTLEDLHRRLQSGLTARPLLRWLIRSDRLPEYRLAKELEQSPAPA